MKILMIGGTGVISAEASKLLLALGHQLYLLNRGNRSVSGILSRATPLVADIHNEEQVLQAIDGLTFDVVADFISYTPEDILRGWRLFQGRTRQFIFISSASAYQKPPASPVITESTPLVNPFWTYSRDKADCENLLMQLYREKGFPVTMVRPSHTYDETKVPVGLHGAKGSWQVLHRMRAGKPVLVHGDGTSLWTFTHARDFARGFAGLAGNIHAIGEAVHITSDESLTWNQAYAILADILQVPLKALHVPSRFLAACGKAAGYSLEGPLLGDKANSVIFDNTKLKRLAPGFAATTRFDQGARESVEYILEHPELQTPDPAFDAFCDRVAAAMESALQTACEGCGSLA